jgi:hypothetical protein
VGATSDDESVAVASTPLVVCSVPPPVEPIPVSETAVAVSDEVDVVSEAEPPVASEPPLVSLASPVGEALAAPVTLADAPADAELAKLSSPVPLSPHAMATAQQLVTIARRNEELRRRRVA